MICRIYLSVCITQWDVPLFSLCFLYNAKKCYVLVERDIIQCAEFGCFVSSLHTYIANKLPMTFWIHKYGFVQVYINNAHTSMSVFCLLYGLCYRVLLCSRYVSEIKDFQYHHYTLKTICFKESWFVTYLRITF